MKFEKRNFQDYAPKRVSFILNTKNRADYLRRTLELHRALIHPDDELIIIDGQSSDHTAEVVKEFADIVDVFVSEPDISGTHALNKGILISQGKYIKHLPDDDIIYREGMEQAIQVLEEHPEVDLLVCGGTKQMGEKMSTVCLSPGTNYGSSAEDVIKYGACGTGFVIRRSALSRTGLFHLTNLVADQRFVLDAIKNGANVKFCRINLYHHPILEHSVVMKYAQENKNYSRNMVRQYCSKRFEYRLRLNRWSREHGLHRFIIRPSYAIAFLRREGIRQTLLRIVQILLLKKKAPASTVKAQDYMWDGGFS